MESLLRWSIANSDPNAPRPSQERLKSLDPGIIDTILGKPDAVLMREAAETALDERKSEDERAQALEDFEMVSIAYFYNLADLTDLRIKLVQHLDNANGISSPVHAWTWINYSN